MGSRLGQHFLIRGSILEKIAKAACPAPEPLVIEIGPGKGALTERLLKAAERVIAIEVDSYLVTYLRQKFRHAPNLTLIENDVLKTGLGQWGPAVIAGNLPYYITSPILQRVFETNFRRAVFLVQKEVGERLTASPGSRDFGYLTIQTQLFTRPEYLFSVSGSAFQPPPKVDSAVVRLTPRPRASDTAEFLEFAGLCFQHKRKTLRNNLRHAYGPAVDAVPEGGKRAEQLSVEELRSVFDRLRQA